MDVATSSDISATQLLELINSKLDILVLIKESLDVIVNRVSAIWQFIGEHEIYFTVFSLLLLGVFLCRKL